MTESVDVAGAYRRGRVTFMGIELLVAKEALVPRAETELLGNAALGALRGMALPEPRVIDMCCGAGNLACGIAHHVPHSRVWASDLTDDCVTLARRNVAAHALADRVSVHQGDLFDAFAGLGLEGGIDAIVCNPPYISEKRLEGDRAHLLRDEPRAAFAAGPYGLSIHLRVVKDALRFLRPGGVLLFEVGLGQARQVEILFERTRAYEDIRALDNESGEARVVLGRKKA